MTHWWRHRGKRFETWIPPPRGTVVIYKECEMIKLVNYSPFCTTRDRYDRMRRYFQFRPMSHQIGKSAIWQLWQHLAKFLFTQTDAIWGDLSSGVKISGVARRCRVENQFFFQFLAPPSGELKNKTNLQKENSRLHKRPKFQRFRATGKFPRFS